MDPAWTILATLVVGTALFGAALLLNGAVGGFLPFGSSLFCWFLLRTIGTETRKDMR